jgi:hypothetical protein
MANFSRAFDFGFNNVELWRSEEMQLVQVRLQLAPAPARPVNALRATTGHLPYAADDPG